MSALVFDAPGARNFEAGVRDVALYPAVTTGDQVGYAWNGVTAISENPAGADATDLFADDIKYATLRAAETFGCTIEAYTYPDAWAECDGSKQAGTTGAYLGQQPRKAFGLVYKTAIGDDQHPGMDKGYKLHIIYNCTASPSQRSYATINDNPDAITFSWEATATPVNVTGYKATACIVVDSTKANSDKLEALLKTLYGDTTSEAKLISPDAVITALTVTPPSGDGGGEEPPAGGGESA